MKTDKEIELLMDVKKYLCDESCEYCFGRGIYYESDGVEDISGIPCPNSD